MAKRQNYYMNKSSRTGKYLKDVRGVVIHWVANPGTSAKNNIDYWIRLGSGVSAHDVVGQDGEWLHAVPWDEMCYQVGSNTYTSRALRRLSSYPNNCVVGIEMTHVDMKGTPTDETYISAVEVAAELLERNNLDTGDLWLHWDVVGWKDCHRWFVNSINKRWRKFKRDVAKAMDGGSVSSDAGSSDDGLLRKGDKGSEVTQLQTELNKLGHDAGPEDGIFGSMTVAALKRFQEAEDLSVDGVFGPNTEEAMETALHREKLDDLQANPGEIELVETLADGDKGDNVLQLQVMLKAAGFDPGALDGIFGPATEEQVMALQKAERITVDGIVGPVTRDHLEQAIEVNEDEGAKIWYRVRRSPKKANTQLAAFRDRDSAVEHAKKEQAYALRDLTVIYNPDSPTEKEQEEDPKEDIRYPELQENIGKRLISKTDGLNHYRNPTWDSSKASGSLDTGDYFSEIKDVLAVEGSNGKHYPQYKVSTAKGSIFYITASRTHVVTKSDKELNSEQSSNKWGLPDGYVNWTTSNDKDDVKAIQKALNKVYFRCEVDGIYGEETADAIRRFQSMYGNLVEDGKYGPATKEQLIAELAEA